MFFPVLSAKLDMSSEIEQHRVLHVSLDAFLAYIASVKKDLASFDAAKLRSLMNDLRGPLVRLPFPLYVYMRLTVTRRSTSTSTTRLPTSARRS